MAAGRRCHRAARPSKPRHIVLQDPLCHHSSLWRVTALVWAMTAVVAVGGCDKGLPDRHERSAVEVPSKPVQVLKFPPALHIDDPTVNAFVEKAMNACAAGSYDNFRVLWTAEQEPLTRAEYDAGWQAVRLIEVRALEPIKLARQADDGEVLEKRYVLMAEVRFDPEHPAGRKEPTREAVLLLTQEQGRWRLARAPTRIRTWVRHLVEGDDNAKTKPDKAENAGLSPHDGS